MMPLGVGTEWWVGARDIHLVNAGCGGVIRDCFGSWRVRFTRNIGDCSASTVNE